MDKLRFKILGLAIGNLLVSFWWISIGHKEGYLSFQGITPYIEIIAVFLGSRRLPLSKPSSWIEIFFSGCMTWFSAQMLFVTMRYGISGMWISYFFFLIFNAGILWLAIRNLLVKTSSLSAASNSVASTSNQEPVISGGWSGTETITNPDKHFIPANAPKLTGPVTLRGVIQMMPGCIRLECIDEHPKNQQVELKMGFLVKGGIREGDTLKVTGRWEKKSYVRVKRIFNESTGVEIKHFSLAPVFFIILVIVIIVIVSNVAGHHSNHY